MSTVVGVVVPAYNSGRYLADTLASIRAQTYPHWVCVVVDDGSTDDTAAVAGTVAAADPRITVLRQDNQGVAAARNAGVAALPADASLLGFLDADDTWLPDALAVLVGALEGRDDAVGAFGLAEYMDAEGRPVFPGVHPANQLDRRRMGRFDLTSVEPDAPSTFDVLVVSGTMWPSAVGLHRRRVLEAVGLFDVEQRSVEDWDLYLRASRHGAYLPVAAQVAWYRRHDDNLTSRTAEIAYYYARVRWKAWRSPLNTASQRRTACRVWRRLTLRRVWWCGAAAGAALRRGRWGEAASAAAAALRFGGQLVVDRPAPPSARMARDEACFIDPRSSRRGTLALGSRVAQR